MSSRGNISVQYVRVDVNRIAATGEFTASGTTSTRNASTTIDRMS